MVDEINNVLTIPQGEFVLDRLPRRPVEQLRAWDAADEYLLDYLAAYVQLSVDTRILIVNDSFGALAVALSDFAPCMMSDSYLSQQATRLNLVKNGRSEHSGSLIASLVSVQGVFDVILIKVPKNLALLEDELIRLRPHFTVSTQIIVAGMIKTMPPSVWAILERLVGATTTSLAKKKARLIFVKFNPELIIPPNPYPVNYRLENTDYYITNHANVFSHDGLDIGTRFFLQHLPSAQAACDIIDLGCGNGVVGLMAAERNPSAVVHFVDESFMAVASAQENFQRAFGGGRLATFRVGDGLSGTASAIADIILCNPPFHQQNTIDNQIAMAMFKESRRVLRKGGQLWVIGNRHLNYHVTLKRLFGKLSTVAANSKFVILKATA